MSVTGLLVKSFALGMAFMALLLVSYYYMSLSKSLKPWTKRLKLSHTYRQNLTPIIGLKMSVMAF